VAVPCSLDTGGFGEPKSNTCAALSKPLLIQPVTAATEKMHWRNRFLAEREMFEVAGRNCGKTTSKRRGRWGKKAEN